MSVLLPVSPRCAELLRNPPAPGEGRHRWLFQVAASMLACDCKPEATRAYLDRVCALKGWQDRATKTLDDIFAKLEAGLVPTDYIRLPPWPAKNHEARMERYDHPAMFDPASDAGISTYDLLMQIYKPTDLICAGWNKYKFTTMPAADLAPSAHNAEFIVGNTMTAEVAANGSKRNKTISSHPDTRRFAVIEFDTKETREQQAAVLSSLHSPDHPLVLAVWSGGKSIHGWFNVHALSPYLKLRFFRFAAYLGADESLYDMSKLVRMPGGTRNNATKQTIIYWEPEHL